MDAVQEAVLTFEDDSTFDAGRGSFLNAEGEVELDAMIMEGAKLLCGAVAAVRSVGLSTLRVWPMRISRGEESRRRA